LAAVPRITVAHGVHYLNHPHHRNGMPGKSQWAISEADEVQSFIRAGANHWLRVSEGWGLHVPEHRPCYLGYAQDRITRLFVAKFVCGNARGTWHGYPADHQTSPRDIPDEEILQAWINLSLVTPAKTRKLAKGQSCNL